MNSITPGCGSYPSRSLTARIAAFFEWLSVETSRIPAAFARPSTSSKGLSAEFIHRLLVIFTWSRRRGNRTPLRVVEVR